MLANWIEPIGAGITAMAIVAFLTLGAALRRHAARQTSGHFTADPIVQEVLKKTRRHKLQAFQIMAREVIEDVTALMSDETRVDEARALKALVTAARKKGESLVASRQIHHAYWRQSESALFATVEKLWALENQLGALPRSSLTLEDVLAGRFPNSTMTHKGA
jgi:hypothetical protein